MGTALRAVPDSLGTGGVLLREVQLEGKRRLPAADFLRGHPILAGSFLEAAAGNS